MLSEPFSEARFNSELLMFPVRLIATHPRLVIPNEVEESLVLGDVSTSPDMTKTPEKIQNFIDGQFVEPLGGRYFDNIEPATGKAYSQVADSDARDVDLAVAAAEKAFIEWSRNSGADRSRILLRIADFIERDLEKLARAESIDTGKPLSLARTLDIPRAASNFRFFATAILHTESEAHITDNVAFNYTLRQPRGIAGLISPWNLPLYLLSWKIAPAIAVGNTRHRETKRANADDRFLALRNLPRSGPANRRAQRRARHRAERRRGDHGASEDQHHLVHRRHRDRTQGRRSVRAVVQKSFTRAGWQKSEHHFRRCRSGRRHRRQRAFVVRQPGPGLSLRLARLCRTIGLQ